MNKYGLVEIQAYTVKGKIIVDHVHLRLLLQIPPSNSNKMMQKEQDKNEGGFWENLEEASGFIVEGKDKLVPE